MRSNHTHFEVLIFLCTNVRPIYLFFNICEKKCIVHKLYQHKSGYGCIIICPHFLISFALVYFICGFYSRIELREHIEGKWKLYRNRLVKNSIEDPQDIANINGKISIENIKRFLFPDLYSN